MNGGAPICQLPNPLDRLFCALDAARNRLGLPGADVQIHLELAGALDVEALRRAIGCVLRAYPVAVARFGRRRDGEPVWFSAAPPPIDAVLTEHAFPAARDADDVLRMGESWMAQRTDWSQRPALRFDLFNQLAGGAVLVLRYPHMLMDGRAGLLLLRRLSEFHEAQADPASVRSFGDERRGDFGRLGEPPGVLAAGWRALRRRLGWSARRAGNEREFDAGPAAQLVPTRYGPPFGRLRVLLRRGTIAEWAAMQMAVRRTARAERLVEFIRLSALRAVHELRGAAAHPADQYTAWLVVDQRRSRDLAPVCRNLFSTLPVRIRADRLSRRGEAAAELFAAVQRSLREGFLLDALCELRALSLVPFDWLISQAAAALRRGRSVLPLGLQHPPAVPLGLIGARHALSDRFCGTRLARVYGVTVPSPVRGFMLNASFGADHVNWTISFDESRLSAASAATLLDSVCATCQRCDE